MIDFTVKELKALKHIVMFSPIDDNIATYQTVCELLHKIDIELKRNKIDCTNCALFSECKGMMQKGTNCFRTKED